MNMTAGRLLILIGVICFVLAALPIVVADIGWFPLGWAFVVTGYALVDH